LTIKLTRLTAAPLQLITRTPSSRAKHLAKQDAKSRDLAFPNRSVIPSAARCEASCEVEGPCVGY
jgi:hypothetical protein